MLENYQKKIYETLKYTLKTWLLLISYRIPKKYFMFSYKTDKLQFAQSTFNVDNYNRFLTVEDFLHWHQFWQILHLFFLLPFQLFVLCQPFGENWPNQPRPYKVTENNCLLSSEKRTEIKHCSPLLCFLGGCLKKTSADGFW